jgi:hypothetical protein
MFNLNKKEEIQTTKYMVFGKFKNSKNFIFEKQFISKDSADKYVDIVKENNDYENYEYFLFEQSKDYAYKDKE